MQLRMQPSWDAMRSAVGGDATSKAAGLGSGGRPTAEALAATVDRFRESVLEMQRLMVELQALPPAEVQEFTQRLSPLPGACPHAARCAAPPLTDGVAGTRAVPIVAAQQLLQHEVEQLLHGLQATLQLGLPAGAGSSSPATPKGAAARGASLAQHHHHHHQQQQTSSSSYSTAAPAASLRSASGSSSYHTAAAGSAASTAAKAARSPAGRAAGARAGRVGGIAQVAAVDDEFASRLCDMLVQKLELRGGGVVAGQHQL
jgi:hypothetical protein